MGYEKGQTREMKPLVLFFILTSTVVAKEFPPLFTEEQWNETPAVCANVLKKHFRNGFPEENVRRRNYGPSLKDFRFQPTKTSMQVRFPRKAQCLYGHYIILSGNIWKHSNIVPFFAVFA